MKLNIAQKVVMLGGILVVNCDSLRQEGLHGFYTRCNEDILCNIKNHVDDIIKNKILFDEQTNKCTIDKNFVIGLQEMSSENPPQSFNGEKKVARKACSTTSSCFKELLDLAFYTHVYYPATLDQKKIIFGRSALLKQLLSIPSNDDCIKLLYEKIVNDFIKLGAEDKLLKSIKKTLGEIIMEMDSASELIQIKLDTSGLKREMLNANGVLVKHESTIDWKLWKAFGKDLDSKFIEKCIPAFLKLFGYQFILFHESKLFPNLFMSKSLLVEPMYTLESLYLIAALLHDFPRIITKGNTKFACYSFKEFYYNIDYEAMERVWRRLGSSSTFSQKIFEIIENREYRNEFMIQTSIHHKTWFKGNNIFYNSALRDLISKILVGRFQMVIKYPIPAREVGNSSSS